MYSKWTQHLKDQNDKEKFEKEIKGARDVLERLSQIYDEDETVLLQYEISPRVFDKPNWDYLQAFYNGYKACIAYHKKVIDLDQQEHKS